MFKLCVSHTYDWPVDVKVPDGGQYKTETFTARFKVIPQDRWDELVAGQNVDAAVVKDVLVGWADIADEQGQPLPFDGSSLEQVLGVPYVRTALVQAYMASLAGAREKN